MLLDESSVKLCTQQFIFASQLQCKRDTEHGDLKSRLRPQGPALCV